MSLFGYGDPDHPDDPRYLGAPRCVQHVEIHPCNRDRDHYTIHPVLRLAGCFRCREEGRLGRGLCEPERLELGGDDFCPVCLALPDRIDGAGRRYLDRIQDVVERKMTRARARVQGIMDLEDTERLRRFVQDWKNEHDGDRFGDLRQVEGPAARLIGMYANPANLDDLVDKGRGNGVATWRAAERLRVDEETADERDLEHLDSEFNALREEWEALEDRN